MRTIISTKKEGGTAVCVRAPNIGNWDSTPWLRFLTACAHSMSIWSCIVTASFERVDAGRGIYVVEETVLIVVVCLLGKQGRCQR